MTQLVLHIENFSAVEAIRALVKNMIGVEIVSESKSYETEEEPNLTTRICNGLEQVKMIRSGQLPRRTVEDMLNGL